MRAFTREEKERIHRKLLEAGRELFGRYGFRKTSVAELTREAGISQGAFYLFFPSKELLWFAVLEREEEEIKQTLMEKTENSRLGGKALVEHLLMTGLRLVGENPVLRRVYEDEEWERMFRKLPPEVLEEHQKKDEDLMIRILREWAGRGVMIREKPEVAAGVLRAFFMLNLHRREIGEEVADEVIRNMASWIAAGLVEGKDHA
ncbi:TetR/AcrR family transcriptional regulator [Staphylospora marina]|uniref:TetR/AcrR family transcriptional regulator n=1 Tax=Staphylospora marina TaxID=2490858 RepID=UPI0013DD9D52|nr:TetR/AcrR family transcriptional regulator [Staphylospora marina]